MDLLNIDGMFLLKMLWVIIKATLECKMECFILRFSASWNNVFEQPFTIKLQLKVSSNFVYILFLTFTSDFWRNSSSKSALRSWFRKLNQGCSIKKGVLRNFAKFTGKRLCQSLFFNKVAGQRPAILLKKRLWHRCFTVNFAKCLRTPFLTEHLWWLLLQFIYLFLY